MGKTIQYTIITNKEYSFPNCINKLSPSVNFMKLEQPSFFEPPWEL